MKKIALLGASGSIGKQTIQIIEDNPKDFQLVAFSVGKNIEFANEILNKFATIKCVSVQNREDVEKIKFEKTYFGVDGLEKVATETSADIVLTAVVGSVGLKPTIEAIKAKKDIALANKETLVTAGHLIMPLVKKYKVSLLPVDSEHSAIFQCLNNQNKTEIEKIILTASGGSFREKTKEELKSVTLEEALKHPNWSMGEKITIDSATMFNKGLEVIEAHWLFDIDYKNIDVIIHKESIIHSMVQYIDNSVIAQLGTPDMKLPIQLALTYPKRMELKNSQKLNLAEIGKLNFEKVDYDKYPAIRLAYKVGESGGSLPTVYNAANEEAVDLFLNKKITYLDIYKIVEKSVNEHQRIENPSIEQIQVIDQSTREKIKKEYK